MVWGAMSSAGVGPLCFLRSKVNTAVYQEVLEHFMLPAADQLYGDADFIFQQDLAPAHSAKATSTWFKDHGISVLNWPANSPDLNPIENLWGIVKRKMRLCQTQQCRRAEGHYQSNLGSHNTWAVPQTYRLHATPHCCNNSGKRSPNEVLSAVHAHTFHVLTFQLAKISKNPFFVLVLSNILIFWDTEFGVFISCQLSSKLKEINTLNISVCVEWMNTLYKFHFLNGISEINQLFDDILIIWSAPVCIYIVFSTEQLSYSF